jgi:hypothetical protein
MTCTSTGCTTICAGATCHLCSTSRRAVQAAYADHVVEGKHNNRELVVTDYTSLGKNVSATVKTMARSYLSNANNSLAAGGCLGNTNSLSLTVTFVVNQAFIASNFKSLSEVVQSWKNSGY